MSFRPENINAVLKAYVAAIFFPITGLCLISNTQSPTKYAYFLILITKLFYLCISNVSRF